MLSTKHYHFKFVTVWWYLNKKKIAKRFIIIFIVLAIIYWIFNNAADIHSVLRDKRHLELDAFGYVVLILITFVVTSSIPYYYLIASTNNIITPVTATYDATSDVLAMDIASPPYPLLYHTQKTIQIDGVSFKVVVENKIGLQTLINFGIRQSGAECYRITTALFLALSAFHQQLPEIYNLNMNDIKQLIRKMDTSFDFNLDANGNICGTVKNGGSRTKLLLSISREFGFYSKTVQRFKQGKIEEIKYFIETYGGFQCGLLFPPTISSQIQNDGKPFILKPADKYDWDTTIKENTFLLEHALYIGGIVETDEKHPDQYYVAINTSGPVTYLLIPTKGEWGSKVTYYSSTYPVSNKCLSKMAWKKYQPATTAHLSNVSTSMENEGENESDNWGGDSDLSFLYHRM